MGRLGQTLKKESSRNELLKTYTIEGWIEGSFWEHEGAKKVFQDDEDNWVHIVIDFEKESAQIYIETFYDSYINDYIIDLSSENLYDYESIIDYLDNEMELR